MKIITIIKFFVHLNILSNILSLKVSQTKQKYSILEFNKKLFKNKNDSFADKFKFKSSNFKNSQILLLVFQYDILDYMKSVHNYLTPVLANHLTYLPNLY